MSRYFFLLFVLFLAMPSLLMGAADPNTVAVWSFEEAQGDQVLDASGNGYHGELIDGKWTADGKFGGAIKLDGISSYVEVPASDAFDLTEFTVELWFQAESINGTRAILGHGESFDTDKAQYIIEVNDGENPGKIQIWYEADNDDDTYVASTTDINPGDWYFFAATRNDAGVINIYLDGELETTTEQPVPPASIGHIVTIGCRTNQPDVYQDFFHGIIDEVRISNVARSQAEIQESFQNGFLSVMPQGKLTATWGELKRR